MSASIKDTIAILGLGKVGTAMGFLLKSAGYRIIAVASRSESSLKEGAAYTGGTPCPDFAEAAAQAEYIMITTSDDAIAPVCESIAKGGAIHPGDRVIHMSGAGGLDLLNAARNAGAHVASIHPLQSFPDMEGAIRNIPGSTFGITAEDEVKDWAVRMVRSISGVPFFVPEKDKPLYHAAACIASNYLTTLIRAVEDIYETLGMSRDEAVRSFWPLVMGTLKNIETKGTAQALTGPIARGDIGTLRKHLEAFQAKMPSLLEFYCLLGTHTADLGVSKKTLSPADAEEIKKILRRYTS
ncbi:MAG: DUF2520 domain-containing protein [Deltaproteobacteria bacterium]|nr:DUF2520 domain-containing protein [Deltaproteobacteria bacterium]